MTLKVLNIPYEEDDLIELMMREISPIYNRDGWYYDSTNKKCWIERNGKAFDSYKEIEEFKRELFKLNCDELRKEEKEILNFLIKIKPKKLQNLVSNYEGYINFRNLEKDLRLIHKEMLDLIKTTK